MQSVPKSVLKDLAINGCTTDEYYSRLTISDRMTKAEFIIKLENMILAVREHEQVFSGPFISNTQKLMLSNFIANKKKLTIELVRQYIDMLLKRNDINFHYDSTYGRSIVFIDTETTGLDPFTDSIVTTQQFSFCNGIVLFGLSNLNDCSIPNSDGITTYIGHNLKFDLKFFIHRAQYSPNRKTDDKKAIFDTMVAEHMLTNGIPNASTKLIDCVSKYYKTIRLNKDLSTSFKSGIVLTDAQKLYAMQDVAVLPGILIQQLLALHETDQLYAYLYIESEFVATLAKMEMAGIAINSKEWLVVAEQNRSLMDQALVELNDTARGVVNIRREFESPIIQQNLFEEAKAKMNINWNSPIQVKKVLGILGHKVDCTDEKTINYLQYSEPVVNRLLNYKKFTKLCSTYGEAFLNFVRNGRLHSDFIQSVSTYRLSSSKPKNWVRI